MGYASQYVYLAMDAIYREFYCVLVPGIFMWDFSYIGENKLIF